MKLWSASFPLTLKAIDDWISSAVRALPLLVTHEPKESVVTAMAEELPLTDKEREMAVQLFKEGLPPLSNPVWLPFLFGVSPKLIGAMGSRSEKYYRTFRLKKRSGGEREIVTPRRFLKTVQRWMLHHVIVRAPVSEYAHGFVIGKNIFSNAAGHLGRRNLLAVDLADFFPTVTEKRILSIFLEQFPFPTKVASQLTSLVTLGGRLPQGAPTSPALANVAFFAADRELAQLADRWQAAYTRYADDIGFSANRRFTNKDVDEVSAIVSEHGFRINSSKTRIAGPGQRQMLAGIVVNEKAHPPRETRRLWRAIFDRARKHPREFVDRGDQLAGIASFVNQYDPELAKSYHEVVDLVRAAS